MQLESSSKAVNIVATTSDDPEKQPVVAQQGGRSWRCLNGCSCSERGATAARVAGRTAGYLLALGPFIAMIATAITLHPKDEKASNPYIYVIAYVGIPVSLCWAFALLQCLGLARGSSNNSSCLETEMCACELSMMCHNCNDPC